MMRSYAYFRSADMPEKRTSNAPTRLTELFARYFKSNQTGGILLLVCTLISLFLANSIVGENYRAFWEMPLHLDLGNIQMHHTLAEWINDGLMTVFFLLVGLEIERELYIGELSNRKSALLPVFAALGGMLVPALIYLTFNFNQGTIRGMGIPTATDIAFAIAIMGILGDRVPNSLKIFLTALAIIDDIGAIFVIAIFYGSSFSLTYLLLTAGLFGLLLLLNKWKVVSLWIYLPLGLLLWFFMMHSGIHPTLSGVLLAFAIPFQNGAKNTSSYRLEKAIQTPVTLLIIPLFALANTAIVVNQEIVGHLAGAESLGIIFGLVIGKPLGIYLFSFWSTQLKITEIPGTINRKMILGAGMLGGIGFTMAMFVTNLAFNQKELIELGKISILIASAIAASAGYLMLSLRKKKV
jgi:NhaA family Na+:H+ antiporter